MKAIRMCLNEPTSLKRNSTSPLKHSRWKKIFNLRMANQILFFSDVLLILVLAHSYLPSLASNFLNIIALFIFVFQVRRISAHKSLTIVLFFLLILSLSLIFLLQSEQIQTNGTAKLYPVTIYVDPRNADVYIDGELRGNERTFQLPAGKHTIRVEKKGYNEIEKVVNVPEKGLVTFHLKQ